MEVLSPSTHYPITDRCKVLLLSPYKTKEETRGPLSTTEQINLTDTTPSPTSTMSSTYIAQLTTQFASPRLTARDVHGQACGMDPYGITKKKTHLETLLTRKMERTYKQMVPWKLTWNNLLLACRKDHRHPMPKIYVLQTTSRV